MDERLDSRTAPFYTVQSRRFVSVEHPAVIQNIDRAIDTLRGNTGISRILDPPRADTSIDLALRPEDAMARPLRSTSSAANNILLKITVPKRTGRKRKRGSDEPFTNFMSTGEDSGTRRRTARDILQTLRDSVGRYQIEPVGLVQRTHVFRGMPDFVCSTAASPFATRFRDQILSFDLDKMKEFDIDMAKGATSDVDIIPPPSLGHGDVPFPYIYRQNPSVKQSVDSTGKTTTVNVQQATKVLTYLIRYDDNAPTQPRSPCPPISTLDNAIQRAIAAVQPLFDERPVWTRRALRNSLPNPELHHALRYAIPYVGYIFRSGPWRDAIVKFGHDPRSSLSYRIYQTFMFKLAPREPEVARDGSSRRYNVSRANTETYTDPTSEGTPNSDSHIFTGLPPLPRGGRIWMACDLTDPLLRRVLFPDPEPDGFLRETCDILSDGWYGNGTLAKVKAIMRNKIQALSEGRIPDNREFERILEFPSHATDEDDITRLFTFDSRQVSNRDLLLATEIRGAIKSAPSWKGAQRKRRGEAVDEKEAQLSDLAESEGAGEEEELEEREIMEAAATVAEED